MNEYRFTGRDKETGKIITDVMRADDENAVRDYAEARGIELGTIGSTHSVEPVRPSWIGSCLLGYGEFVSLIGCAVPVVVSLFWLGSRATTASFIVSILGGLYSASMLVVFSRAQQLTSGSE